VSRADVPPPADAAGDAGDEAAAEAGAEAAAEAGAEAAAEAVAAADAGADAAPDAAGDPAAVGPVVAAGVDEQAPTTSATTANSDSARVRIKRAPPPGIPRRT
jgi:hypothetical protein